MQKLSVKRVLIDVDGTMTDSPADFCMGKSPLLHLVELVMEQDGLSSEAAEQKIRSCGNMEIQCLSEFLPMLGVDPVQYFEAVKEDLARHITIPEDTVYFLKAMRERGISVCAATTNSRFMTLAKLAVGGLADISGSPYIAAYHAGCEFGDPAGKFSEHYFPNILKHHGFDPETTMMIGDEPEHDLYPALKAGIRYGVIIDRRQREDRVQRGGGIFVRNLGFVNEII
ncbi:MAG: HAD family hydrolase [Lentisphaeria bacterium]|nr:HAD family hydrolase [Lentisphaeria bacterium]